MSAKVFYFCDQCQRPVDYESRWMMRLELPKRPRRFPNDLHFCSGGCCKDAFDAIYAEAIR